jgi:hypothetical protein
MKITRTNTLKIDVKALEFTINKDGNIDLFDMDSEKDFDLEKAIREYFEHGDVLTLVLSKKDVDTNME